MSARYLSIFSKTALHHSLERQPNLNTQKRTLFGPHRDILQTPRLMKIIVIHNQKRLPSFDNKSAKIRVARQHLILPHRNRIPAIIRIRLSLWKVRHVMGVNRYEDIVAGLYGDFVKVFASAGAREDESRS
jgi:hypothetical protein